MRRLGFLSWLGLIASAAPLNAQQVIGLRAFDSEPPPPYRVLSQEEAAQRTRGYEHFVSAWGINGEQSSHVGLGPLYNASSCNECHVGGRRGRGPERDGEAPTSLVIRLGRSAAERDQGDPVYGHVLSTHAIAGATPEGTVHIEYKEVSGYYYPFGGAWQMREPRYRIAGLTRGPLSSTTIISPRIAPALFGLGLLEAVPEAQLSPEVTLGDKGSSRSRIQRGRFGWQNEALSIRDQTTRALADEMGVTSLEQPTDDCTVTEIDCYANRAVYPEASDEIVADITAYLETLAVPALPGRPQDHSAGARYFEQLGCAQCHQPHLTARLSGQDQMIAPYTDLRLHDLGMEMSDETAAGVKVATRWRTAPLWGMNYRFQAEKDPTFLHDGRARSLEEAILWHYGEAAHARFHFMSLGPNSRETLLKWLQSL